MAKKDTTLATVPSLKLEKVDGKIAKLDLSTVQPYIDEALKQSKACTIINTDEQEAKFNAAAVKLKDTFRMVEDLRKMIKAPFEKVVKLIDGTVKMARTPLETETLRINEELERVAGARRRRERAEQEELEKKAAIQRLDASEAQRKGDPAKAMSLLQESQKTLQNAAEAITKTPGQSIRLRWEPKLIDPVKALAANPGLLVVSPNYAEIQKLLNDMEKHKQKVSPDTLPGFELQEVSTIVHRSM